jgi:uncharacterized protein
VDRVFLDANILFSAAYDERRPVATLWRLSNVELVTSAYAAAEATRNIVRKYSDRLPLLVTLLSKTGVVPTPEPARIPTGVSLHPKDVPILAAAIHARATYLLTGDRHFEAYFGKSVESVTILPVAEFLRRRSI